MCRANPLWGAPRIHGELLKLGIEVCETTVAKYMIMRRGPPSQAWKTFLENHVKETMALDFFMVPTATFKVLFVLVILSHDRRRILHFNVTEHPTAVWTARQLFQACGIIEEPDTWSGIATRSTGRPFIGRRGGSGLRRFQPRRSLPGRIRTLNA